MLGHEGAGVVTAVGPGVASVTEGDHVVVGWPWCGQCRNCLAGELRYCVRLGELLVSGVRPGGGPSALRRALEKAPQRRHVEGGRHAAILADPAAPLLRSSSGRSRLAGPRDGASCNGWVHLGIAAMRQRGSSQQHRQLSTTVNTDVAHPRDLPAHHFVPGRTLVNTRDTVHGGLREL
ncbi:alcohol dehydrogenase catalytic domain-containing protein [Nonomuraea solani]|uniref:alcohol dehydrogenase catalytic domain-containing protein n=1 Tax=Nonomuraea solani TaxID=1144553 RepID=UPI003898FB5F